MDKVLFSRNGSSHPLGKLDSELPKIKVPEALMLEIFQRSSRSGVSVSEYMREVLMIHAFGEEAVISLYAERTRRIALNGEDKG